MRSSELWQRGGLALFLIAFQPKKAVLLSHLLCVFAPLREAGFRPLYTGFDPESRPQRRFQFRQAFLSHPSRSGLKK